MTLGFEKVIMMSGAHICLKSSWTSCLSTVISKLPANLLAEREGSGVRHKLDFGILGSSKICMLKQLVDQGCMEKGLQVD